MNPDLVVEVDRVAFREAIRTICVGLRRKPAEIRIEIEGGALLLQTAGAATTIDARGHWPGAAFVPAATLKGVAGKLPASNPLHLRFRDGRFWIEGWSVTARWQDISPPPLDVPADLSPEQLEVLKHQHSQAVLASSGLLPRLNTQEQQRQRHIRQAADLLKPYGITADDLERLVRELAQKNSV